VPTLGMADGGNDLPGIRPWSRPHTSAPRLGLALRRQRRRPAGVGARVAAVVHDHRAVVRLAIGALVAEHNGAGADQLDAVEQVTVLPGLPSRSVGWSDITRQQVYHQLALAPAEVALVNTRSLPPARPAVELAFREQGFAARGALPPARSGAWAVRLGG